MVKLQANSLRLPIRRITELALPTLWLQIPCMAYSLLLRLSELSYKRGTRRHENGFHTGRLRPGVGGFKKSDTSVFIFGYKLD